jgi:hypothetical protein
LLRAAGIELTTMAEHYGEQAGQRVADVDWIAETAQRGWLAFNKDAAIRRNQAEANAVMDSGARLFCVPRADLTSAQLAERFIRNWPAIVEAALDSGPYIYGVYPHEIRRLLP